MTRADTNEPTLDFESTAREPGGRGVAAVLLTVLLHSDVSRVGERAVLFELSGGREASLSREVPLFAQPSGAAPRPLGDPHISRTPLVLSPTRDGGVRLDPRAGRTKVTTSGAPILRPVSWSADTLREGVVIRLGKEVVVLLQRVDITDVPAMESFGIVGDSPAIHRVLAQIGRVASLETPVLVRGETGTGKELCARALHQASARHGGPFLAVNLAAVPPALAAAELFGVERGAFTGAHQERPGYFALARGGTLFLDEIGDAPLDVQAMLLRAIETGEVQGVGSGRPQRIAVRLVAATDADLEARALDGRFRAPLLHRLSAHQIWMPPLRERRDDIARLLVHFLREELAAAGYPERLAKPEGDDRPWLSASLVARLVEARWRGNVRHLRNVVRGIAAGSAHLERAALDPATERALGEEGPASAPAALEEPRGEARRPASVSEAELSEALRSNAWEPSAAAAALGISRASIYLLIRKSKRIRTAGDLSAEEIARSYRARGGDVAGAAAALEVSEAALRRRIRELGIGRG